MSLTAPPTAPSTSDPTTFASRADALVAWYATNVSEMNAFQAALSAIAAGTACAIPYTFSTTTTDADPGAGFLRLGSATQNTATVIRADLVGADGSNWTSVIDTFDDSTSTIKGHIMLQKLGDATKWLLFSVSALASPTGYKNITVSNVASSAASPFSDGDSIILKFTRNGDAGTAVLPGLSSPLAVLTPTAAANVDALSAFGSTYDNYLIILSGIQPSSSDTLAMRFANAGSADSGSNYYIVDFNLTETTSAAQIGLSTSSVLSGGKGADFVIQVLNANDSSQAKAVIVTGIFHVNATPTYKTVGRSGVYVAANAISGVRFFWTGGANFSATGKIRIYGYNNT